MVITPPIQVATIGMTDSLVLMVIALVVLGPRRLPQVGRQIGKLMYEFRKASNDFKYQMEEELRNAEEADRRKREEAERQKALAETQNAVAQAQSAAEQALNAAAKAQSAALAAQGAVPVIEDSPVPESEGPGAPASVEPDMMYTFGVAEETVAETAAVETEPGAEGGLRIQPPSTGEQVAAARPGRAGKKPAVEDAAGPAPAGQEISAKKEVAGESPEATEPATNHG